jgi:hypothetical protein
VWEGVYLILLGEGGAGGLPQKILKLKMPNLAFWLYFSAKLSQKIVIKMTFCMVFKISIW